jgi:hypothetical protein
MTFIPVIAASVCLLGIFALGKWLASHVFPRPSRGFLLWWRRAKIAIWAFIAATSLIATFLFGAWLTSPAFPVAQKFVAVSLNGEPIISASQLCRERVRGLGLPQVSRLFPAAADLHLLN